MTIKKIKKKMSLVLPSPIKSFLRFGANLIRVSIRPLRIIYSLLQSFVKLTFSKMNNMIPLYWFSVVPNFGDALNVYLIERISGRKVMWVRPEDYYFKNYMAVGSVIPRASSNTIIWGSGITKGDRAIYQNPKEVLAVRGPLTRKALLSRGIHCPDIYGDPALLLPRYYKPQIKKKYKFGIIPHYVDKEASWLQKHSDHADIKIIDVATEDVEGFVDQVLECEYIASSSLHGLIIADAYGIPSLWVKFSDKISGGNFKYHDYFMSVGRNISFPVMCDDNYTVEALRNAFHHDSISIDLNPLIEVCPFVKEKN